MMYTKQWMVTHKWMLDYTHQTEWIERRGIMVWIAEVFTSLGAGLYLVSLFFNSIWGMIAAWCIIMFLKVPIHLAYFGKPLRFWRTLPPFTTAWKTSWFTRGIMFTVLFGMFAFVQIVLTYLALYVNLLPSNNAAEIAFKALAGIMAFMTGIYGGFIMNYCKSIPFWRSNLLPVVFLLTGIADGFALIIGIGLAGGHVNLLAAETGSRIMLLVSAVILAAYLVSAAYRSPASKKAVIDLMRGHSALAFWLGVVMLGILVPILMSAVSTAVSEAIVPQILIIATVCHTLGAFALKYCLLKEGIYRPLLSKQPVF